MNAKQGGIAGVILLSGLIALYAKGPIWDWATIGAELALAGVVVMLFRDRIFDYGEESFEGLPNAERLANSKARVWARRLHPFIYAIGIPLVIISAIFQVVGNPSDKLILRAKEMPQGTVFKLKGSDRLVVDLDKLDKSLNVLAANQRTTSAALGEMYYTELIVVNCGAAKMCLCPVGYERVKHTGNWNLNAGTTGDSITLCSANRKYLKVAH